MKQITFYSGNEMFKIDKPIRLIELFAGYGSQHLSLKYLGIPFESWHICEWAVKSIQAYKDLHFESDNNDYSKGLTADGIIDYLANKGISADYNKPMTREQIKMMGETKCRQVYNNIKATKNLVNVMQAKAEDLEITETDKYCYVMTYSFPCQDLSKAGKGKGMAKGSGTRSGMLWQVERLLDECNEKPQVLLMENVPDVIGTKNIKDFAKWVEKLEKLEKLGYHNYWQVLNSKNYGIPQNRERCFMVSIHGDYYYDFPEKQPLKLRLKDMLEDNVDEKYYLSEKIINYYKEHTEEMKEKGNGFRFIPTDGDCIARAITTRAGGRMDDNFINQPTECEKVAELCGGKWEKTFEQSRRVYGVNGLCPTLHTTGGGNQEIKIMEPNCIRMVRTEEGKKLRKQYEAHEIKHGFNEYRKPEIKTDGCANSLTTVPKDNLIVEPIKVKEATAKGYAEAYEGDSINLEQPNSKTQRGRVGKQCAQTLTTSCNQAVVEYCGIGVHPTSKKLEFNGFNDTVCPTLLATDYKTPKCILEKIKSSTETNALTTDCGNEVKHENRIRKLTPKECWRLMGVKDEDFEKVRKNQSDSSLYHLAGDSIVVDVLMSIFGQMYRKGNMQ